MRHASVCTALWRNNSAVMLCIVIMDYNTYLDVFTSIKLNLSSVWKTVYISLSNHMLTNHEETISSTVLRKCSNLPVFTNHTEQINWNALIILADIARMSLPIFKTNMSLPHCWVMTLLSCICCDSKQLITRSWNDAVHCIHVFIYVSTHAYMRGLCR